MKQTEQLEYPYFHTASNNSVTAVYVVHPELLAVDDVTQRGRPFLFYTGSHHENQAARQIAEGWAGFHPYVGKREDLEQLVAKSPKDAQRLPEQVMINSEEVLTEKISSGYVPFSFGVGHEYDCQRFTETNGGNVRLDLEQFKEVFAGFEVKKEAEKAEQKARAQYEATLGYKVRSLFGMA